MVWIDTLEDATNDDILAEYTLRFGAPVDVPDLYSRLLRGDVQGALATLEHHLPGTPSDAQRLRQYRRLMDGLPLGAGSAVRP